MRHPSNRAERRQAGKVARKRRRLPSRWELGLIRASVATVTVAESSTSLAATVAPRPRITLSAHRKLKRLRRTDWPADLI